MKMRSGFVSNSSSSSFVVAIPKVPKTAKEVKEGLFFEAGTEMIDLKKLMFGEEVSLYGPYDDNQQEPFDAQEVADIVKRDMESQTPNSIAAIAEELSSFEPRYGDENVEGLTDGVPEIPEYEYDRNMTPEESSKFLEKRQKLEDARGRILAERFIKANKNCDVYVFSYADENGSLGSMMEHGNIFKNFKHVTINYH